MLIGLDSISAADRVLDLVEYFKMLLREALAQYSLFYRLGVLPADKEYPVAAVRSVCTELPVVFRLVLRSP